ncbi:MAG: cytochrome c [Flavipsychrobacter sp.]|nr:cytochrome c [Flavipsychrobacter sp.]
MKLLQIIPAAAIMIIAASCGGDNTTGKNPYQTGESASAATQSGESIYKTNCASCHMAGGEGIEKVYPPLAKSDYLADRKRAITQIIKGSSGEIVVNGQTYNNTMPPQQLDDAQIAAVLTYVYTNMGNTGTAVTAEEVKAVRASL